MRLDNYKIGKTNLIIILLIIIVTVVFLLCFQYIFLIRINRDHAYETGEVLADQVVIILESNDHKQQILTETLKENYISKAKAIAYFLDNNHGSEFNLDRMRNIAELMSIDEIHLFNEKGEIYSGTIPKYYGYSFDSGEQMAYFKPMLTDKTLSMCQDITPNTAESKSMMYAICWNNDGSKMIQVGIEPLRLIEELHTDQIREVVDGLPVYKGMNIIVADEMTGKITGSTIPELFGTHLSKSIPSIKIPETGSTLNYALALNNDNVYCTVRKTDKNLIFISQSMKEVNAEIPQMMLIMLLYMLLAVVVLVYVIQKLTIRIIHEKRNADTDAMTGLLNRRAYENKIQQIEENPETERKDLVCIMFDINELKMINDNYGHDAGDTVIKTFAGVIKKVFGSYGIIYRIGGDEFAAFLYIDDSHMVQLINDTEAELAKWTAENKIGLSMSYGVASAKEFPELNTIELLKVADERMYKSKSLFYQKSGHDRRLYKKRQPDALLLD